MPTLKPAEIIVALDVPTAEEALDWVNRLAPYGPWFKVGMQLFYQAGPPLVHVVKASGCKVFLDLKLHDIPHTVAGACRSLAALEPDMLTVHAVGGPEMMVAAANAFAGSATQLVGVTVLTSLDAAALAAIYPDGPHDPAAFAQHLAQLAVGSGLAGVVCSPLEARALRHALGPEPMLVTPGIRPADAALGDQKRVATATEAVANGATHLVVGRPILQAADPEAVLRALQAEIALPQAEGTPR